MGTNYYFHPDQPCPTCGRKSESIHIGKCSAGWCFALHVYTEDWREQEERIANLSEWIIRWTQPGTEIYDEYHNQISVEEMLAIITERNWRGETSENHSQRFLDENQAEPGPNGLLRSRIDGRHTIGHGDGTWDLCIGEFS